mgnify:CR=1 FL=1
MNRVFEEAKLFFALPESPAWTFLPGLEQWKEVAEFGGVKIVGGVKAQLAGEVGLRDGYCVDACPGEFGAEEVGVIKYLQAACFDLGQEHPQ